MEVLYHIRPYFLGIFPETKALEIGLIYGIGTSNTSVPEMAIEYITILFSGSTIPTYGSYTITGKLEPYYGFFISTYGG
jgi:hypothetical protein